MNDNTAENNTKLYREKTYDIASASEQITDRLRVTDPGVFIILCAVILLLAGVLVWSIVDTMEETSAAKVLVKNGEAVLVRRSHTRRPLRRS